MWIRTKIKPTVVTDSNYDNIISKVRTHRKGVYPISTSSTAGFMLGNEQCYVAYNLVKKRKKMLTQKKVTKKHPETGKPVITTVRTYSKPTWTAYVYSFDRSFFDPMAKEFFLTIRQNLRNFTISNKNFSKKVR